LTTKKEEEVNHRDTENTEAKQKRRENLEKRVSRQDAETQRNIKKRRRKRRKVFQSGFIRSFESQLL